jgi:hypothetical protein
VDRSPKKCLSNLFSKYKIQLTESSVTVRNSCCAISVHRRRTHLCVMSCYPSALFSGSPRHSAFTSRQSLVSFSQLCNSSNPSWSRISVMYSVSSLKSSQSMSPVLALRFYPDRDVQTLLALRTSSHLLVGRLDRRIPLTLPSHTTPGECNPEPGIVPASNIGRPMVKVPHDGQVRALSCG